MTSIPSFNRNNKKNPLFGKSSNKCCQCKKKFTIGKGNFDIRKCFECKNKFYVYLKYFLRQFYQ